MTIIIVKQRPLAKKLLSYPTLRVTAQLGRFSRIGKIYTVGFVGRSGCC